MKCKHSIFLASFVLILAIMVQPLSVSAATVSSVGVDWDGIVDVSFGATLLYLDFVHYKHYVVEEGNVTVHAVDGIYSGNNNARITLNSVQPDTYLNGFIRKRIKFTTEHSSGSAKYIQAYADPVTLNGVYCTLERVSYDSDGTSVYDIYIQFDNYYVNSTEIILPLLINVNLSLLKTSDEDTHANAYVSCVAIEDYAGSLTVYGALEDVPSIDGTFADQNNQIINNTTINNQLQEESNVLLDDMMHSFDTTHSDETSSKFDNSIANYEKAESQLTDTAIGNFNQYTIPEQGIASYGINLVASMRLVSSMMQSIYTSAGDFNIVVSVGFVLVLTSMVVGLYKFFVRS